MLSSTLSTDQANITWFCGPLKKKNPNHKNPHVYVLNMELVTKPQIYPKKPLKTLRFSKRKINIHRIPLSIVSVWCWLSCGPAVWWLPQMDCTSSSLRMGSDTRRFPSLTTPGSGWGWLCWEKHQQPLQLVCFLWEIVSSYMTLFLKINQLNLLGCFSQVLEILHCFKRSSNSQRKWIAK